MVQRRRSAFRGVRKRPAVEDFFRREFVNDAGATVDIFDYDHNGGVDFSEFRNLEELAVIIDVRRVILDRYPSTIAFCDQHKLSVFNKSELAMALREAGVDSELEARDVVAPAYPSTSVCFTCAVRTVRSHPLLGQAQTNRECATSTCTTTAATDYVPRTTYHIPRTMYLVPHTVCRRPPTR